MRFTNPVGFPAGKKAFVLLFTALCLWWISLQASQSSLVSRISAGFSVEQDELHVVFTPEPAGDRVLQLEKSTDLENWSLVAFRPVGSVSWQSLEGSTHVETATGVVTAKVPAEGSVQMYARVTQREMSGPDEDDDSDGIANWLEDYVENEIPEGRDSDGDGVSDQVELLMGTDPGFDEFATEQQGIAAFATGLMVFTPLSE